MDIMSILPHSQVSLRSHYCWDNEHRVQEALLTKSKMQDELLAPIIANMSRDYIPTTNAAPNADNNDEATPDAMTPSSA